MGFMRVTRTMASVAMTASPMDAKVTARSCATSRSDSSFCFRAVMSWQQIVSPSGEGKVRCSNQRPRDGLYSSTNVASPVVIARSHARCNFYPTRWGNSVHMCVPTNTSRSRPRVLAASAFEYVNTVAVECDHGVGDAIKDGRRVIGNAGQRRFMAAASAEGSTMRALDIRQLCTPALADHLKLESRVLPTYVLASAPAGSGELRAAVASRASPMDDMPHGLDEPESVNVVSDDIVS